MREPRQSYMTIELIGGPYDGAKLNVPTGSLRIMMDGVAGRAKYTRKSPFETEATWKTTKIKR